MALSDSVILEKLNGFLGRIGQISELYPDEAAVRIVTTRSVIGSPTTGIQFRLPRKESNVWTHTNGKEHLPVI